MPHGIDLGGKKRLPLALIFMFLLISFCAGTVAAEPFTIGIITNVQIHEQTLNGFLRGMSSLGYVEGQNVRYIYNGIVADNTGAIDAEIEKILSQHVDLFLTMANEVSLRVKERLKGSGIPILIAGSSRPVEEGLLESLGRPGGNMTGVRVADNYAKTLEWLTAIVPDARRVLLPYNPDDVVSQVALGGMDEVAAKLGLELVCCPVQSTEEAVAAIKKRSKEIDAIYRMPSPTLDPENEPLSLAAIACKLPLVSCLPLDEAVLMTFSADLSRAGMQTARLAHLIHNGANPADLPVETCDADLTINLKTAAAIDLEIPDVILMQVQNIIR